MAAVAAVRAMAAVAAVPLHRRIVRQTTNIRTMGSEPCTVGKGQGARARARGKANKDKEKAFR